MAKNASAAACEVANAAARSERPELAQRGYLTKAVMCDVHPFCATETLFSHEFSWTPQRERKVVSRCRSWQTDADWPTTEPYLSRKTAVPRPRTFWDIMQLLPNRTVWLHGDSIQLQMCDAAICSLMRAGAASEPVFGGSSVMPARLRAALAPSKYNFMTTLLPNGARLLCSGIGIYQRENVEKVLPHVDVAVLNFGLHYHNAAHFEGALSDALLTLSLWRKVSPRTRVALWREGSAQHFRGTGSYTAGAEKLQQQAGARGQPCDCSPLGRDVPEGNNLNVLGWRHERRLAPAHGVGLVPFFNLTAPRHNMHRGHYCAFDRQTTPGRCCDCTHFCYSPLFWDVVFGGMHRAVRRALHERKGFPPKLREPLLRDLKRPPMLGGTKLGVAGEARSRKRVSSRAGSQAPSKGQTWTQTKAILTARLKRLISATKEEGAKRGASASRRGAQPQARGPGGKHKSHATRGVSGLASSPPREEPAIVKMARGAPSDRL